MKYDKTIFDIDLSRDRMNARARASHDHFAWGDEGPIPMTA